MVVVVGGGGAGAGAESVTNAEGISSSSNGSSVEQKGGEEFDDADASTPGSRRCGGRRAGRLNSVVQAEIESAEEMMRIETEKLLQEQQRHVLLIELQAAIDNLEDYQQRCRLRDHFARHQPELAAEYAFAAAQPATSFANYPGSVGGGSSSASSSSSSTTKKLLGAVAGAVSVVNPISSSSGSSSSSSSSNTSSSGGGGDHSNGGGGAVAFDGVIGDNRPSSAAFRPWAQPDAIAHVARIVAALDAVFSYGFKPEMGYERGIVSAADAYDEAAGEFGMEGRAFFFQQRRRSSRLSVSGGLLQIPRAP